MIQAHVDNDRLFAYSEGELSPEENRSIAAHLEGCSRCYSRVREYRSLNRIMFTVVPQIPPHILSQTLENVPVEHPIASQRGFWGRNREAEAWRDSLPRPRSLPYALTWSGVAMLAAAVSLGALSGMFVPLRTGDAAPVPAGITRDLFEGVRGPTLDSLRRSPNFPMQPDRRERLSAFGVGGFGDFYGQRIYGYLNPPVTGEYTFWIAADENGELWLSTDADPAHAGIIARATSWTLERVWDRSPQQRSARIYLKAGQRYYIEALMKEEGGGDHLAVKWMLPDGTEEAPIPAQRFIESQ